ncbi:hypothetical protein PRK78_001710 [Emydomyces testavorans]|uniref:Uncharacterized protein n=1 Tax=Emydomyces testavorans TaxID=2070801 RepID=A0AAF0DDC8_9EURO|nr:hypothetical protein PRK78_001710 [Emydomyces testavorans]
MYAYSKTDDHWAQLTSNRQVVLRIARSIKLAKIKVSEGVAGREEAASCPTHYTLVQWVLIHLLTTGFCRSSLPRIRTGEGGHLVGGTAVGLAPTALVNVETCRIELSCSESRIMWAKPAFDAKQVNTPLVGGRGNLPSIAVGRRFEDIDVE